MELTLKWFYQDALIFENLNSRTLYYRYFAGNKLKMFSDYEKKYSALLIKYWCLE